MIVDILTEGGAAFDDEAGGADAGDFNAEFFEEETEVLDHVVRGGADDSGLGGREGGGHENIFCNGVAALGEDDVAVFRTI